MFRSTHPVFLSVICVLACGGGRGSDRAASHTVDSAGAVIVTSDAPRWTAGEGWRIDTIPLVDIDGDDSVEFSGDAAIAALPGNGFVVEDEERHALRFFTAGGASATVVGRKGQGPGEFESISRITVVADSVIVWDGTLRRLSVFTVDGRFVGSTPFRFSAGIPSLSFLGPWPSGRALFVQARSVSSTEPLGLNHAQMAIVRHDVSSDADTVLGHWPASDWMAVTSSRIVATLEVPYLRKSTARWLPDGFIIGTAEEPRFDRYDTAGKLVRSVRWHAAPVPIPGGELAEWKKSNDFSKSPPDIAGPFMLAIEKTAFPAVRAPYEALLLDAAGSVWTKRAPKWNDLRGRATWDVFALDGDWLGGVELPASFTPRVIGVDRILGTWADTDDVTHVRVYRINR